MRLGPGATAAEFSKGGFHVTGNLAGEALFMSRLIVLVMIYGGRLAFNQLTIQDINNKEKK